MFEPDLLCFVITQILATRYKLTYQRLIQFNIKNMEFKSKGTKYEMRESIFLKDSLQSNKKAAH